MNCLSNDQETMPTIKCAKTAWPLHTEGNAPVNKSETMARKVISVDTGVPLTFEVVKYCSGKPIS